MGFLEKNWARHCCIVIGILLTWQAAAWIFRCQAECVSEKILEPVSKNYSIRRNHIQRLQQAQLPLEQTLLELLRLTENEKLKHKAAFNEFYPYYFASSAFLLILSSVSVVVLFMIAQKGFKDSSPYLKTVALTMAALTSFYAVSPLVFRVEGNITTNLSKYIAYDNLQSHIFHFALKMSSTTDPKDVAAFYDEVEQKMRDINSIDVQFDFSVIKIQDYKLNG